MCTLTTSLKKGLMILVTLLMTFGSFAQTATAPAAGDGSVDNPYQVATLENLYWLSQNDTEWDKHYIQTADIDATATKDWDAGAGFSPIGNDVTQFTGSYNGKGHIIDSLYINRPEGSYVALFGYAIGSGVHFDSLGLENVDINGWGGVASLVGQAEDIDGITSCYSTGSVEGEFVLGGLFGRTTSSSEVEAFSVNNSYSSCGVYSRDGSEIGGLGGDADYTVYTHCYSTGSVSGTTSADGGFLGLQQYAQDENSFWDMESSGYDESAIGTGLTTAEMKTMESFTTNNWDFANESTNGSNEHWGMHPEVNDGYPFLTWQWEGPVPIKENLPALSGEGSLTVSSYPKATGPTCDTLTATTEDPLEYTAPGEYTITWTYTDGLGKTSSQTQEVVVEDVTAPEITCVEDQEKEIASDAAVYLVSGDEFNPAAVSDDDEVASLTNDFNDSESLEGAEFQEGTTTVTWLAVDPAGNSSTCSFDVTVSVQTASHSLEALGLELYPNPVTDRLQLSSWDGEIEGYRLYDLTGKVLLESKQPKKQLTLDLSGYTSGIYFISIRKDGAQTVQKIIKQ